LTSSIRDLAQKYNVRVHRKVEKFIQNEIREPPRKEEARLFINDLPNYPFLANIVDSYQNGFWEGFKVLVAGEDLRIILSCCCQNDRVK